MRLLLDTLNRGGGVVAPRDLQAIMSEAGYSRMDVQEAIQLALSRNLIRIDTDLRFESAVAA
jgi:hypothetical protein